MTTLLRPAAPVCLSACLDQHALYCCLPGLSTHCTAGMQCQYEPEALHAPCARSPQLPPSLCSLQASYEGLQQALVDDLLHGAADAAADPDAEPGVQLVLVCEMCGLPASKRCWICSMDICVLCTRRQHWKVRGQRTGGPLGHPGQCGFYCNMGQCGAATTWGRVELLQGE
jgi:hypothetical protein